MTDRPAVLVLETGEVYEGEALGADAVAIGEVVFNTALTGYQEVLTDPSYAGQLVTMTYPHIGNTGVNAGDVESARVQPAGFIVREPSRRPSNFRSQRNLHSYLRDAQVSGIAGVDTRALTRRIRDGGAAMGIIAPRATAANAPALLEKLLAAPRYDDIDYVARASVPQIVRASLGPAAFQGVGESIRIDPIEEVASEPGRACVVVMDFGVKYSILRHLLRRGLDVVVVPSATKAAKVLELLPQAVVLSNGPGDPARLGDIVSEVQALMGQVPLFGICLGHQLLGQALGAKTFKLLYGHRGANQPVLDRPSGRVLITSQNHGYAVVPEGLSSDVEITQVNLNDHTVEGLRDVHRRIDSVQYHPEAGPGPHDADPFFQQIAQTARQEAQ